MPLHPLVPPCPVGSAGSGAFFMCLTALARAFHNVPPILIGVQVNKLFGSDRARGTQLLVDAVEMLPPGTDVLVILSTLFRHASGYGALIAGARVIHFVPPLFPISPWTRKKAR